MLSVVKMLIKEDVGGSASNSYGNYNLLIMENHEKRVILYIPVNNFSVMSKRAFRG